MKSKMKNQKSVTVERIDEILRWIDEGASFDEAIEDEHEQEQILRLARDGARSNSDEESNANWSNEKFGMFESQVKGVSDGVLQAILDNIKVRIGDAVIDQNKSYEREQLFKAKIVLDEMNKRLDVRNEVVSN
ncbi:hypothetical protein [Exiguobacterium profundum]|uniref:hypothetical protein n=1 Tax=Exiguobacterium profundum TaxID=307643 RepID=UPI003512E978